MNKRGRASAWLWTLLALLAIVAVGVAACGDDDDDDGGDEATKGFSEAGYKLAGFKEVTVDSGAAIKVGISSALSGDVKGLGEPIANAAELAGDGVTIKGHKIEFVREDDLCSPDGGTAAADRLIKAGVVAVVGPICSITTISPSATAPGNTNPARSEGPYVTFFRTTFSDAIQGPTQAKFAKEKLNAKTAYIVFDTDAYGTGLRDAFKAAFEKDGGKIVGKPEGFAKKTTDFKAIIANIKKEKPDLVYFSGFYAEATPFLKQLRAEADLKDTPFLTGDGPKNDELLKGAGEAAEGAYFSLPTPSQKGAAFDAFAKKYEEKTKKKAESGTYVAESFDAGTVIIKALEKVATDDGGKLKIDLKKLNEAIRDTVLEGASGTVDFGNNGDNLGGASTPVSLWQVKDGKFVEIK
ncbi:branched-chain amino acid ABC transporter substrate-binding protein [bacterium]|nr:MAG: branched-chain amino acid ABC transporter substrate-binding protein [bacterium]